MRSHFPFRAPGRQPLSLAALVLMAAACEDRDLGTTMVDSPPPAATAPGGGATARNALAAVRAAFRNPTFAEVRPPVTSPALASSAAAVSFPADSSGAVHVAHPGSGVAVAARMLRTRRALAEWTEGYAVYPGAAPDGGSLLHRALEDGAEDYVTFETRPVSGEVSYELTLSAEVAGLRLVGNSLEFLDGSSTPRLRVAPPFVVGSDGASVDAVLAVAGCAIDTNPAAPWDRPVVAPGHASCVLSVRWDMDAVQYPAVLDPAWTTTNSMATGRHRFIAAAISGGRVLVAGGWSQQSTALRSAEIFTPSVSNPSTGTWASTALMTAARAEHAAAVRGNGQVLVTGGLDGTNVLASAETYDPSTGAWTSRAAMSRARNGHRATALGNGDVLVSGGTSDGSLGAQRFGNSTGAWTGAGTMLSYHAMHSATSLADGRVLCVGDQPPAGQIFDPANNAWSATPTLPALRNNHTATRLSNGTVLVAGGSVGNGNTTELFNPSSGVWSRTGNMWQRHYQHTATLLTDGRVVVFGNDSGNSRTLTETFDPSWGTWSPGPSITPARDGHVALRLSSGRVFVAGGASNSTVLTTTSLLDATRTATTAADYQVTEMEPDADILGDRSTEIRAVMHRPTTLPAGRLPLLLFLHGAHKTCGRQSTNPRVDDDDSYAMMGTCPGGYAESPSYRGFDYLATELAARGYIVVSVNANRGFGVLSNGPAGDESMIQARAKLVLKHLQYLSAWNRGASPTPGAIGVSLAGKLDLSQVGLLGHSRGGNAMRALYNYYKQPGNPWPARIVDPVTFRGIFEIEPTDIVAAGIQGGTQLNATNVRWNVLLGTCDGDVQFLDGMNPFDRMMVLGETTVRPKSMLLVWGANHSYFNSEWQEVEGFPETGPATCTNHRPLFAVGPGINGSAEQRQTAFRPVLAFFRGNVGATDPWFDNQFNPEFVVASEPQVDRAYTPGLATTSSRILEDFTGPTGTSSFGLANNQSNVTITHVQPSEHFSETMRAGDISWTSPGPSTFFQTNFAGATGFDLRGYQLLDLRVDRVQDVLNGPAPSDFDVALVNADNSLSTAASVSAFNQQILGPPGGGDSLGTQEPHSMLQTVRIPLSRFTTANLAAIRGVRLTFSDSPSGRLYVANIRATRSTVVQSP